MYEWRVVMICGKTEIFYANGKRFEDLKRKIGKEMAENIAYVECVEYVD